jgi:GTP-binding protein
MQSAIFLKGITGDDSVMRDGIPQIAFVGRSNAGKSSLLNSIAGVSVARSGKKQGKTVEINFFKFGKLYLVDLPGYGFAQAGLEQRERTREMIIWYLSASRKGSLTIALVLDSKVGITDLDRDMIDMLRQQNVPFVVIANKSDKLNQSEMARIITDIQAEIPEASILPHSAKTGKGKNGILQTLLGESRSQ